MTPGLCRRSKPVLFRHCLQTGNPTISTHVPKVHRGHSHIPNIQESIILINESNTDLLRNIACSYQILHTNRVISMSCASTATITLYVMNIDIYQSNCYVCIHGILHENTDGIRHPRTRDPVFLVQLAAWYVSINKLRGDNTNSVELSRHNRIYTNRP